MRKKKLKLQNQDEEIRRNKGDSPQVFKGMVIHVYFYLISFLILDQRLYKTTKRGLASFDCQTWWRL